MKIEENVASLKQQLSSFKIDLGSIKELLDVNVITAKKVKYVTGSSTSSYTTNTDIADKIWLPSFREMYGVTTACYTVVDCQHFFVQFL